MSLVDAEKMNPPSLVRLQTSLHDGDGAHTEVWQDICQNPPVLVRRNAVVGQYIPLV